MCRKEHYLIEPERAPIISAWWYHFWRTALLTFSPLPHTREQESTLTPLLWEDAELDEYLTGRFSVEAAQKCLLAVITW